MARYVEDLALALPLICGPDGEDPATVPAVLGDPAAINVADLRVAWYADNGIVSPDPEIARVVTASAKALKPEVRLLDQRCLPAMRELVDLSTEFREVTNVGVIQRLLQRFGTTQPGPDLDGYFSEKSRAASDCINPVLLESIDTARAAALTFFADYDAILCPPSRSLARPHGASQQDSFDDWSYMTIHNLLGWPGVSVRAGTSAEGLPVGVQVVAAPWREDIALKLAHRIESLLGGFSRPPL